MKKRIINLLIPIQKFLGYKLYNYKKTNKFINNKIKNLKDKNYIIN